MVTFVAIILLVAVIMGVLQYRLLEGYFRQAVAAQLSAFGPRIQTLIEAVNVPATDNIIVRQLAAAAATITQSRAVVTDARGFVLIDTADVPNLAGEVMPANVLTRVLRGRIEVFDFPTAGPDAIALALPWVSGARVTGSLLLIRSVRAAARQITADTSGVVLKAALLASAVAAVVAYFLSSTITGPLQKMAQAAQAISRGSFKEKVDVKSADELGDLAQAMNSMSDEISALIDSLTQEKEKLRALIEERTNMMSDISHDLRTPVTSIRGFVEALRDGIIKDEAERAHTLDIIHEESERLARLVDDLFYMARLESEESPVEMKEIDLLALVRNTVETITPLAMEKDLSVRLSTDEAVASLGQVKIVGSADRLTRAILNLLDNAVKYSPRGGQVKVNVKVEDGNAVVSVSDEGPGIPADEIPRLFERFYRADKARSRARPGAGLGLSIAKLIVEQHGGSVRVDSVVGRGSTFSVSLPMAK